MNELEVSLLKERMAHMEFVRLHRWAAEVETTMEEILEQLKGAQSKSV